MPVASRADIAAEQPDEVDSRDKLANQVAEFLPSWMSSLVFHLALVLILALIVTTQGGFGGNNISLDLSTGGSESGAEGDGGILEEAVEMPSELASAESARAEQPTNETMPDPLGALPQLEMPELSKAAGALAGMSSADGNGDGDGSGEGEGEGDGTGDGTDGGIGIGPVRTSIFGLVAEGEKFVYVFDRSESMNSVLSYSSEGKTIFSITPLEAAKAELIRSLEHLHGGNGFGIVCYNHEPFVFSLGKKMRGLFPASKSMKAKAVAFVRGIYGQGMTAHVTPLEIALRLKPDVVFLLTDGEEKDDPNSAQLEALRKLNGGRAKINVIQFVHEPRVDSQLQKLAAENGGKHIYFNMSRLGPGMGGVAKSQPQSAPLP